tara:strand:+ start:327 stop:2936 length:2610 start_codon:yes stop_codon:yes gene_type:complete
MAAIKLQKFIGVAPKVSPELLPDGAAQTAHNLQLYSGDLLPYSEPKDIESVPRLGTLQALHGMRATPTSAIDWLTWTTDVDVITISDSSDDDQRFYYSGDGAAKVSTYSLATTGNEPYPGASDSYYDLGLPLPTVTPTSAAASFVSPTSAKYQRDSGNTAIITTAAAHGLSNGNIVTVRGFSGTVPITFNVTNTRITVTSSTTFEYYSAGAAASETSNTDGVIDLAGGTITRDYTYTWFTPWGEESIGAAPSDTLYVKEGQQSTVSGLPTAAPSGDNFITGIKLYRTLSSASGTEFYHLSDLWFPQTTATVALTSNVATVTMATHHGFLVGDRFKLQKCTDTVFNIIDGIVTVVVSDTAFSYAVTNANISSKSDTTGQLYHDVAEIPTYSSRYYGDDSNKTTHRTRSSNVATLTTAAAHGLISNQVVTIASVGGTGYNAANVTITVTSTTAFTYTNTGSDEGSTADTAGVITNDSFTDDFDYLNLVDILLTDDFDPPAATMTGLTLAQNNMVAGFFDNQLCFAEPNKPWAWPLGYRVTFEHDIIAIEVVGGYLIVLTDTYAYRVSGNDPLTLSVSRIDTPYPCLSKQSVVNMGYGVLFATYGGLALWSPAGISLATKYIHDWDTWDDEIDPSTIVGHFYNDKYFGSHSTGSFLFERDEKIGGYYVTAGHQFNSAWTDVSDNALYTSSDTLGSITQWGSTTSPLRPMEWKSKTVVTKDYLNLGAARIIADYTVTTEDASAYSTYNTGVPAYNTAIWAESEQLGTVNGPTDYAGTDTVEVNNFGGFNTGIVNGPSGLKALVRSIRTVPSTYSIVFKLFQNKSLVFTQTVTNDSIFRCPSGYKSDTFEVSVSSAARVRSIHLSETPDGLRKA